MIKKLNLADLNIKSFITQTRENQNALRGGGCEPTCRTNCCINFDTTWC